MRPADNPFRVERMHALAFEPQGQTWDELLARLERLRLRAAVVGPHGSGKTTLLRSLAPRLEARGLRPVMLFRNAEGGGGWPAAWGDPLHRLGPRDVLLVDGYDLLAPLPRWRLRRLARRAAGLVGTSHRPCLGLPTLVRTATSPELLREIVSRLAGRTMDADGAARLLARHHGNIREALRELYDAAASPHPAGGAHAADGAVAHPRGGCRMLGSP